jgi:hypothetical protein
VGVHEQWRDIKGITLEDRGKGKEMYILITAEKCNKENVSKDRFPNESDPKFERHQYWQCGETFYFRI